MGKQINITNVNKETRTISTDIFIDRDSLGRFKKGHQSYMKGKKHSEDAKRKMSIMRIGKIPWNKGLTKETDERVMKNIKAREGYKHSEEARKKIGNALRGKISRMRGYKHTKEARKRMSESRKGKVSWNKGLIGESYLKHFKNGMGHGVLIDKDNPNWKGGVTPLNNAIRHCEKYKEWRMAVFKRDNYVCQKCGKHNGSGKSVYLEGHHIKPFTKILKENKIKTIKQAENCEELWDINNGQTLCSQCHNLTKKGGNKNE